MVRKGEIDSRFDTSPGDSYAVNYSIILCESIQCRGIDVVPPPQLHHIAMAPLHVWSSGEELL